MDNLSKLYRLIIVAQSLEAYDCQCSHKTDRTAKHQFVPHRILVNKDKMLQFSAKNADKICQ